MSLLDIALKYVGVKESPLGSNSGPEIDKWLHGVGLPPGNSWCQAFIHGCGDELWGAGNNKVVKTASVMTCWNTTKQPKVTKEQVQKDHSLVKPGDQAIMSFGHGTGHTYIVRSIDANGTIYSVEGNSNEDGSREGYEVAALPTPKHSRHLSDKLLVGFISYS